MNRSTKVTRILLVAAFAAGLTACSSEGDPSAAPTASASASVSEPAVPSSSPSDPAATAPEATASASPGIDLPRGTDGVLRGDVSLVGADSIAVAPKGEKAQEVELTPFTEVLDVQGAVCSEGKAPRKCTTDQLRKALKEGTSFYAKVTVKDGTATQIKEIIPE
ncbi:hypothetical protein AB0B56_14680 [Streptosporangium canum]|uniref:hypothetical protein n=1 Tax=Streptosporangium canum TaxID=324952 RepID=UPI0034129E8E